MKLRPCKNMYEPYLEIHFQDTSYNNHFCLSYTLRIQRRVKITRQNCDFLISTKFWKPTLKVGSNLEVYISHSFGPTLFPPPSLSDQHILMPFISLIVYQHSTHVTVIGAVSNTVWGILDGVWNDNHYAWCDSLRVNISFSRRVFLALCTCLHVTD